MLITKELLLYFICPFVLSAIIYLWGKKKNKVKSVGLILLVCIGSFCLSGWLTKDAFKLKDEVIITALGEVGSNSYSNNVGLRNIVVDGKTYSIDNPKEGKWFWGNEGCYMWRDPAEEARPDGVTDSIILEIPVGCDRYFNMLKFEYSGLVEVIFNGDSFVYDTSVDGTMEIPNSTTLNHILDHILHLIVYLGLGTIFSIFILCLINSVNTYGFSSDKTFKYIMILVVGLFFIIVTQYSSLQSFWLDELYQVKFSGGKSLLESLMETETTPPLYRVIANIWYRIMPYGEHYLLLLSQIFVAVAIVLTGYSAKLFRGNGAGYIATIMYAFSTASIELAAYEFRSYSLMCMLSAAVLYILIKKYKSVEDKRKYYVIQGIFMVLLCYTHYHGLFLCMVIGFIEVIVFLQKREFKKLYKMIPYGMCVICYLPWVFRVIEMKHMSLGHSWLLKVSFASLWKVLKGLMSDNTMMVYVLIAAVFSSIIVYAYAKKEKRNIIEILPTMSCIGLFIGLAFYGVFISPKATLWLTRYFLVLLPFMILIISTFVYDLGNVILEKLFLSKELKSIVNKVIIVTFLVIAAWSCSGTIKTYMESSYNGEDFRGAADWLYNTQDEYVYLDSSILYYPDRSILIGLNEYYITKQGTRDGINVAYPGSLGSAEAIDNYDRVYVCTMGWGVWNDSIIKRLESSGKFELVETVSEYKMTVYQRKSEEL